MTDLPALSASVVGKNLEAAFLQEQQHGRNGREVFRIERREG